MNFRRLLYLRERLRAIRVANRRSFSQRAYYYIWSRIYKTAVRRDGGFVSIRATIGDTPNFVHEFQGVFIAGEAVIGDRCQIYHHVTIGAYRKRPGAPFIAPVIGSDVLIGAGATIIGRCTIGDGAHIGAGVVLTNVDVPPGAVIVNKSAYDLTSKRFIYPQD